MKIETDNDRLMMIAAFRYGLGRMTYIVGVIVGEIIFNWADLNPSDQELIQREIREAILREQAGWDCDIAEWNKILSLPLKH